MFRLNPDLVDLLITSFFLTLTSFFLFSSFCIFFFDLQVRGPFFYVVMPKLTDIWRRHLAPPQFHFFTVNSCSERFLVLI